MKNIKEFFKHIKRIKKRIKEIFSSPAFSEFNNINVMPLIYDEKNKQCNIILKD